MRKRVKLLALIAGVAVAVALGVVSAAGAGTIPRTRFGAVGGSVRFCGGARLRGASACRPLERSGRVKVRAQGRLVMTAPMRHGKFSLRLHTGRYGLVVFLGRGSDRSRPRLVQVVAHRTTHVTITFEGK